MALFNKYFGQENNDSLKDQSRLNENVSEYINAVDYITDICFHFKDLQSIFSDLDEEHFDLTQEERDRVILRAYEPIIISLAILGYYFLRDLNFASIFNDSILDLLKECKPYRSTVMKFTEAVADSNNELYFAILRDVKPVTLNFPPKAVVYLYFSNRFNRYSLFIIDGLDGIIKNPNDNYNHLFGMAYLLSINPHEKFPLERDDDDYLKARNIFKSKVEMAYWNLKKKLSHG